MWKKPWTYKEGTAICGALFLTGVLLQISVGKIDWELVAFPVNLLLLGTFSMALLLMSLLSRKVYLFRWMQTYPPAITALLGLLAMTVLMGLTRQLPPRQAVEGPEAWFGFSQMLSAWPFACLFTWLMTVLGIVIIKRFIPFRLKHIPFQLSHLGLFIAVTGAVAGSGDIQKLKMITTVGKPEWRAYDGEQLLRELPLAIELTAFTIDEYPPKLMLIDNETGKALPVNQPAHCLLEENVTFGKLEDWQIRIEQQLPEAASFSTADTLKFVPFHSVGATYAVYVKTKHIRTGAEKEGWVSCGSFLFPYRALRLDDYTSLVMPEREPRRFASDVKLYTQSGKKQTATIEVNHPLEIEGWKIYQSGYDETKGKWSDVSIFELVRDPWLPVVYTGIWMLIAGAVWTFITASQKKENKT